MDSRSELRKSFKSFNGRMIVVILASLCLLTATSSLVLLASSSSLGNEDQVESSSEEQENQLVPYLGLGTWIGGGAQPSNDELPEDVKLEDQLTNDICRNDDPLLYLLVPSYAKDCAKPMEKMQNNLALHHKLGTQLANPSLEEEGSANTDQQQQRVLDTIRGMGQVLAGGSNQLCDCKMITDMLGTMLQTAVENPDLFHYALFSDNVLVASVVVRSTVMNAQDPSQHAFHLVIDTLNFRAMSMWFRLNHPKDVTIQAQSFRGFSRPDSSYSPLLRQLESAATKKLYFKNELETSESLESCSDSENPKYWNPEYISILDRLRSFLLNIFPKLTKVLLPQDHFTSLWSINLEEMMNSEEVMCGGSFNHLATYLTFRDLYISESFRNTFILKGISWRGLSWREQEAPQSIHSQISQKVCGVINTTTSTVREELENEIWVSSEGEDDTPEILEDSSHISIKDDSVSDLIILISAKPLKKDIEDFIKSCIDGLKAGNTPELSKEGTGGAYFMKGSSGKTVGVFKPSDEEPMAANNPRGLEVSKNGEGAKKGTKVGEGALREVAAYLLDHDGFSGVPPTVMVECRHIGFHNPNGNGLKTKRGSLQMFVENEGSLDDLGLDTFPVEEVQKISVLDLRLANADRHVGNILRTRDQDGKMIFVPIDHGYTLPSSFEDCTFEWVNWPQAKQPYSEKTQDYIRTLDAESDITLLKSRGLEIPLETARTLIISTRFLQEGSRRGLTASAIGGMMSREIWDQKSPVEEILEKAKEEELPGMTESDFLQLVFQFMDDYLNEMLLD
ncbi:PREDICTED: uncharacterized protein LOC104784920 [Camelina sativa]|uniref:1-phosphatidylinositol 4-kinase n=1 Tax=Camelina sativa TaxID=90675 RepID=A0ABM0YZJ5_CAMSA|nr:PREDICTED: uncharacterized protein LOC104784920 [Camelina sativa]